MPNNLRRATIAVTMIATLQALSLLFAETIARKVGDTLVYEVVSQGHISGGHPPSQAYAPQAPQNSSIKIAVTSIDSDGTALVHVSIDHPYPAQQLANKGPAWVVAAGRKGWEDQNRYKEFDARLTRDGALLFMVDLSPQEQAAEDTKGKSLAKVAQAAVAEVNDPKYQAMLAENQASGTFAVPNVIALSCAKRTLLATGDSWHVVSKANNAEYDVKVTGTQAFRGRDAVVLSAKSHSEYPNSTNDTDSIVYYDLQAHVVVGAHLVYTGNMHANGMTSTVTTDLNLKE